MEVGGQGDPVWVGSGLVMGDDGSQGWLADWAGLGFPLGRKSWASGKESEWREEASGGRARERERERESLK